MCGRKYIYEDTEVKELCNHTLQTPEQRETGKTLGKIVKAKRVDVNGCQNINMPERCGSDKTQQ